ncbi:TIGR02587 family membrane protein [Xanthobacteraceae bacterium A53D]
MATHSGNASYSRELARAAGGAILFSFPLAMTMEMWWLGFYMERERLALFLLVALALLVGLSRHVGFAGQTCWRDVVLDAFSAFLIACLVGAAFLLLFGVASSTTTMDEFLGKVALQSIPAGIGAILARKQFATADADADDPPEDEPRGESYGAEMFLMFAGAIFVAFNVAPTDEIELIAALMTPWHALTLALVSLLLLHILVYRVELAGQETWPEGHGAVAVFVRYSLAGYGVALIVAVYVLWTFGRLDGSGLGHLAMMTTVLGFPAALGAATARLVV